MTSDANQHNARTAQAPWTARTALTNTVLASMELGGIANKRGRRSSAMTSSRDRDSFASLSSRAASPAAHVLIDHVYAAVERWESERGRERAKAAKTKKRGTYKRGPKRAAALREVLERFVGDLLRAQHDKGKTDDVTGLVFRSISKQAYPPGEVVTYPNFMAAVDGLKASRLLSHTKGQGRFLTAFGGKNQLSGKASRFEATAKLLTLAKAAGVEVTAIDDHFHLELPRRTLELREGSRWVSGKKIDGGRMSYPSTPHTERLADNVKMINAFLQGFKLGGGVHYGFVRVFNEGDHPKFNWDRGGRLYSITKSSYQQLSGPDRARMTIDGEPVVEIDISASYLTAFYAQLGERLDLTSDPYDRVGLPRDVVKAWMTVSFGRGKPIDRWPRGHRSKLNANGHAWSARNVRDAMLTTYPALRRLGEPGVHWADLMFVEGEAIITAMQHLMTAYRMPSYPVHDSLIVPASGVGRAAGIFADHYQFHVGVIPRLKTDSTLPGVKEAIQRALDGRPSIRVRASAGM